MINPFDKYKAEMLDPPTSQEKQYYNDLRSASKDLQEFRKSNPSMGVGRGYFSEVPTTTRNINYAKKQIARTIKYAEVDLKLGVINQDKYNQIIDLANIMTDMLNERVKFLREEGLL